MLIKFYRAFRSLLYSSIVKMQCMSFVGPIYVNGYSGVSKKTVLGSNVNFNGMEIRGGGGVVIGDNFHSGRGCLIISQIHNYDNGKSIPYDDTYLYKDVFIESNVWLGDRVIVLGGVVIGEGAIIQAGSVVVSDIPKCAIAGGHPARVFKYRDERHYYSKKNEASYF